MLPWINAECGAFSKHLRHGESLSAVCHNTPDGAIRVEGEVSPLLNIRLGIETELFGVEPDIVLIDESIGAVDKQFAEKAAARLRDFVDGSNILILATHNDRLVKTMCDRVFDLSTGEINEL